MQLDPLVILWLLEMPVLLEVSTYIQPTEVLTSVEEWGDVVMVWQSETQSDNSKVLDSHLSENVGIHFSECEVEIPGVVNDDPGVGQFSAGEWHGGNQVMVKLM